MRIEKGIIAQSTAEAEYVAAAGATNQAIWLTKILMDMGEKHVKPVQICCDNKSAIAIAKNHVLHKRTKRIGVRYHVLREAEAVGDIQLTYCSTEEQLADILTKALSRDRFQLLRAKLGITDKHIKEEY